MGDLGLGVCVRPNADHFMYVCSREDGKKQKNEERGNRIKEKGGAVRMRVKMRSGVRGSLSSHGRTKWVWIQIRGRVGSLQDTC